MKKMLGFLFLAIFLLAGCLVYVPSDETGPAGSPPPPQPQEPSYDRGYQDTGDASDYYGYLGPYGLWVSYPSYGYVWIPRNPGYMWRPYVLGHWVWTDYGWTWMSTEQWGWLVYHYGRWGWDGRLGWFWVPGTVWGPSWVAWRWGDLYIGWAPLPPGGEFVPGFGFRRWDVDIPGHYWNFVRGHDFMEGSIHRWVLPPERNISIINYTHLDVNIHVNNNRVINEGLGVDHVRRVTNQVVERYDLRDARRPGDQRVDARTAVVYRPEIRQNEVAKPREILNRDQAAVRLDSQRSVESVRRSPQDSENALRQNQEQERRLLERDHQAEINEIRRKSDADKVTVRNAAEKQKIEREAQAKIVDAKKRQEAEKAQLSKRQQAEADRVKKVPIKKKNPETEKH